MQIKGRIDEEKFSWLFLSLKDFEKIEKIIFPTKLLKVIIECIIFYLKLILTSELKKIICIWGK